MSQRNPRIFLQDIMQSADKIDRFISGMSYDDFEHNELVIDAVIRNLEIIGEPVITLRREDHAHPNRPN